VCTTPISRASSAFKKEWKSILVSKPRMFTDPNADALEPPLPPPPPPPPPPPLPPWLTCSNADAIKGMSTRV